MRGEYFYSLRARPQHPHTTRTGCCRACRAAARMKMPRWPRPACRGGRAWAAGRGGRLQPWAFPASGSAPTHHWSAVLVCSHALGRWRTSCGIAGSAEVSGKGKRTFQSWPPCNRQNACPKGQGNQIGGDQHRRVDDIDAILVGRGEVHVQGGVGCVYRTGLFIRSISYA